MPTENRSSNTEMVSVPRVPTDDMKNSADGLEFTFCTGDEDWQGIISAEMAEEIYSLMVEAAPAPQPHPEPIAWMVGTAIWWTKEEAERDAAATGLPIVGLGPMAGAAEVERLNRALALAGHWCASALNAAQRADDAAESLGDIASLLRHQAKDIEAALSASAEPNAPIAWHVGGNGYDRISFEKPANLPGHPCIQAIHDQRQLIDLLKRCDLRDEDAPPDERGQGIPGTSFQRLNALANQGE